MRRIRFLGLLIIVGCATPPYTASETTGSPVSSTTNTPVASSSTTSVSPTSTSSQVVISTTSMVLASSFPVCEVLPTMYDVVEVFQSPDGASVGADGQPVQIFDLAEIAGVETYRFRSDAPVALLGEYRDGITRYMMEDPTDWGAEWLVDPSQTLILGEDGWVSPRELTITPWLWSEPSIIYLFSMLALPESRFERWEVVERSDVGIFLGGPEAVSAFSERNEPQPGTSVEIWLSSDCYPIRFLQFQNGDLVHHWELFDLGADVDFVLPPEWDD